eukprot:735569-Pyramimonas_sp.AAC.1
MHMRCWQHQQAHLAVHPGSSEAVTEGSCPVRSTRSIASWLPPSCGAPLEQDLLFAQDPLPRRVPQGVQGDQGHRRRLLLDAISRWAEQWLPS